MTTEHHKAHVRFKIGTFAEVAMDIAAREGKQAAINIFVQKMSEDELTKSLIDPQLLRIRLSDTHCNHDLREAMLALRNKI